MLMLRYFSSFLFLFIISVCSISAQSISPIEFGLLSAVDGKERYKILLSTHQEALRKGVDVDYSGISELHIEIPANPISIPLSPYTDFKGLKLYVTNNSKNFYLFRVEQDLKSINISKHDFVSQKYLDRDEFAIGKYLLVIQDNTPWVANRKGYDYGVTRKDVILIENNKALNATIAPYSTDSSEPIFSYAKVDTSILFCNIEIYRTANSSKMTFPLRIDNQDSVQIINVGVVTPETDMYGDAVFSIYNCTNVLFDNVKISGTYSKKNKYGYGIALNNVWNVKFKNMYTKSEWGIFGNYNVNTAFLYKCNINRFDVHCYGKDIYMEDCTFSDFYNQYSSMYGVIQHNRCKFSKSIPCLIDPSFNAYTSFDLYFNHCVFIMEKYKNELVYLLGFPEVCNTRPELMLKSLPNVVVTNCSVIFEDDVTDWHIFKSDKLINNSINYISKIKIKNLSMNKNTNLSISNNGIKTSRKVKYTIKRLNAPIRYDYKYDIIKNVHSH